MTAQQCKGKRTLLIAFFLLLIALFTSIGAKKSSSSSSQGSGGHGSGSGGSGKGGKGGSSGKGGGSNDVGLKSGTTHCTNGLNRCLHTWDSMFIGIQPYAGKGVCLDYSALTPKLNAFDPVCQFNIGQTIQMVLDCGNTTSQQNKIEIIYDGQQATATSYGSARAIFASSEPSSISSLKSGPITATNPNMDLWAYCYDAIPIFVAPANGNVTTAAFTCPDGQSRCMSVWHGDYYKFNPAQGSAVCKNPDSENPPYDFFPLCELGAKKLDHFAIACEARYESWIDITYDADGNGKAFSGGKAKALFSSNKPALSDLLSGAVSSTVPNQNVYAYCPADR